MCGLFEALSSPGSICLTSLRPSRSRISIHIATSLNAEPTSTRSEFFTQLAGIVAVGAALPGAANAASYGGIGVGSPNVLNPKDAIIDDEIFNSSSVQGALKNVKAYAQGVGILKEKLLADSQINLGPYIRKNFEFVTLRDQLNTYNSAFDEDTQRGTDRLIRGIIQDLVELEIANKQPDGVARSERRVNNMIAKLNKLQASFDDLIAFAG